MISQKENVALPKSVDEYTRRFWFASLEASWRGQRVTAHWDARRLNWPCLLHAAAYHRVLASFGPAWEGLDGLPEPVLDEVWVARATAEQRGRAAMAGIQDLEDAARKHSLRLVLLKGATYLLDAFACLGDREMRDVDVLAPRKDMDVLTRELCQRDYEAHDLRRQRIFQREATTIEVHLEAINRRRFWRLLPPQQLLARAEPDSRWPPLLRLSTADEAVLLVLHAYHHRCRQAIWLRDLAAWWRVRQPDPDRILDAFHRTNTRRIGWMAWRGIERMGWEMPRSWLPQAWGVTPVFDRLVRRYWDRDAILARTSLAPVLRRRWLEFHGAEGALAKFLVCAPWVSPRSLGELYRTWKHTEKAREQA
ncbi:MAG: nucleotidyltransferase family protein [Sedimentisphaerales bacterium]|nr:nucleotidyltransferase family protein [Sedimentisphaerales bacterium]